MGTQSALLGADSIENARDTMRDIVPYDIPDEKRRQPYSYNGEDEIEPVERTYVKLRSQQMLDKMNGRMKNIGSDCSKHTHKESKNKSKLPVRDILQPPFYYPV